MLIGHLQTTLGCHLICTCINTLVMATAIRVFCINDYNKYATGSILGHLFQQIMTLYVSHHFNRYTEFDFNIDYIYVYRLFFP